MSSGVLQPTEQGGLRDPLEGAGISLARWALRGTIVLETAPICKSREPKALASTRSDLFGDEAHEDRVASTLARL